MASVVEEGIVVVVVLVVVEVIGILSCGRNSKVFKMSLT